MQLNVACGCGRTMTPVGTESAGHFRCGCGVKVAIGGLPPESDKQCPVRLKRGRCLRPKKTFEPVCERCAVGTARAVLRSSRLCKQIADTEEAERYVAARSLAWQEQRERRLAARRRAKTYGTHVVYYVLLREGVVKIGTTSSLVERLHGLRLQPEQVLAAEPGHHALEKQRHAQFAALRIRKRWEDFTLTDELQAHIDAVADEYGDPFEMQGWLMTRMREAEKDRRLAEAEQLA